MGWDSKEPLAYDVARHSILSRSTNGVRVIPLEIKNLKHLIDRPVEIRNGSGWCPISQAPVTTEFAISRFLIPFLSRKGWAAFVDPDIVCLTDIEKLFDLADDKYAVMVVKHDYTVKDGMKGLGVQTSYPRKNWSSIVLWNCSHGGNKRLTLDMINTWPGRDLHAFKWLKDEEIGELPRSWNYLVDVYDGGEKNIMHFTNGGPWIKGWQSKESDLIWNEEAKIFLDK